MLDSSRVKINLKKRQPRTKGNKHDIKLQSSQDIQEITKKEEESIRHLSKKEPRSKPSKRPREIIPRSTPPDYEEDDDFKHYFPRSPVDSIVGEDDRFDKDLLKSINFLDERQPRPQHHLVEGFISHRRSDNQDMHGPEPISHNRPIEHPRAAFKPINTVDLISTSTLSIAQPAQPITRIPRDQDTRIKLLKSEDCIEIEQPWTNSQRTRYANIDTSHIGPPNHFKPNLNQKNIKEIQVHKEAIQNPHTSINHVPAQGRLLLTKRPMVSSDYPDDIDPDWYIAEQLVKKQKQSEQDILEDITANQTAMKDYDYVNTHNNNEGPCHAPILDSK